MSELQVNHLHMLRQKAEEVLQSRHGESVMFSRQDVEKLLHELNVYQVELEIQNEELRQSQQKLQESRSRYVDLYDFAPVGYFTLSERGQIIEINLAGAALLGIERAYVLQRSFVDFIVWEDRDRYYLHSRQVITTRQRQTAQIRLNRFDTTIVHVQLESILVNDDTTGSPYYRMVVVDISQRMQAEESLRQAHAELETRVYERTAALAAANQSLHAEIAERQRIEEALRASEERFRLVLQDSPITVFNQDVSLRYTWLYNAIPLFAEERALGRTDAELLPPSEAEPLTAIKQEVLNTGQGKRTEARLTIHGQVRWYDLKIDPLRDVYGSIVGISCTATDMTEYFRAREFQRILAEVGTHMARSLDPSSRLNDLARIIVNDLADLCMIHLLGDNGTILSPVVAHQETEVEQQILAYFAEHPEAYRLDLQPTFPAAQVLQQDETVVLYEISDADLQVWSRDEADLTCLRTIGLAAYIGVPLRTRGRTIGILSLVMDRSGRRFEPSDVALAEELAWRAAISIDNVSLYSAEQQARSRAEMAVKMRDQVLHMVSHDLKSPLTAIKGFAHLVQRHLHTNGLANTEWVMSRLDKIVTATNQMARLIQDLLDVAALQAGQSLILKHEPLNLSALIQRVVDVNNPITETHHLRAEMLGIPLHIIGDTQHLERVLNNLVANAIKYSPQGSEIVIKQDCVRQNGQDWGEIRVCDHGVGIPANEVPFIFEPFRRASNIIATTSGTGLGLANARQIIEQHGGTITVSSEEGIGSTFTIRLPLVEV